VGSQPIAKEILQERFTCHVIFKLLFHLDEFQFKSCFMILKKINTIYIKELVSKKSPKQDNNNTHYKKRAF
jgi:hypothetical protein